MWVRLRTRSQCSTEQMRTPPVKYPLATSSSPWYVSLGRDSEEALLFQAVATAPVGELGA
jgi:hypothetical protein